MLMHLNNIICRNVSLYLILVVHLNRLKHVEVIKLMLVHHGCSMPFLRLPIRVWSARPALATANTLHVE